jgi:uncharacterized protein YndB with AHSA1/START domain
MVKTKVPKARVSMIIDAPASDILKAFVEPETLAKYWLSSSSTPLELGTTATWKFMVPGAEVETTLTRLEPGRGMSWNWSDGSTVDIELEPVEGGVAVTLTNEGFQGTSAEVIEAALNATEGFALVLADLKTLLEHGRSAHIVWDKARLIQMRKN